MLSVVVATFRRRDTLQVTLRRLANQTCPATEYEVIVVDDGSGDGTADMVQAMSAEVPYSLRYLCHQNRGPGYTENRGIKEAKGELILLIADDIHLERGALEAHLRFHQEHPEQTFAALGCVLQSPELPKTVFLQKWDPFKYYELASQVELPYWKFWACHISLKREFMLANGLFREHKGAAHEDVELGYRLCKEGLRILYLPQAMAYHYHVETLDAAVRRAYERGIHWKFIEDHVPDPQIWVKYHILNFRTLKYHYRTFRNLSKSSLPASDRFLPWLLLRQILRWIVFNGLTVPYFWLPLLKLADRSPMVAACMSPYFYRGAVFYHFVKGCRDQAVARSAASRTTPEPRATLG
jgi:glycosyltransferase involved in cell wall biosynthesis